MYKALGDEERARAWLEKALAVAERLNNAPMRARIGEELSGETSEVLETSEV